MSNYQFKAGDKVYFPKINSNIFILEQGPSKTYPLAIKYGDKSFDDFTINGNLHVNDKNPSLFLATRENKLLLDELYHMEFDEPITKDSIIQDNINIKGFCLCIASDYEIKRISNIKDLRQNLGVITEIASNKDYQYTANGTYWKYAEPIKLESDGTIIYLADN